METSNAKAPKPQRQVLDFKNSSATVGPMNVVMMRGLANAAYIRLRRFGDVVSVTRTLRRTPMVSLPRV